MLRHWIAGDTCILIVTACLWIILGGQHATGQILPDATDTIARFGEANVSLYRVGVEVTASRGACRNITAMIAAPLECAEQEVRIVEEDISSEVKSVTYRDLQGGVRQMVVKVPNLPNGATAKAIVTFEVRTRPILVPESTDDLHIPTRPKRQIKMFLGESPFIDPRHRTIRNTVKEIADGLTEDATDWQKAEAIYDYVQEKIEYELGDDKTAAATLKDGVGDCYSMSALFVALCRAKKIPARMVWVDNHAYPEFLLEDEDGKAHWFPCQVAGARAFGEMPDTRTILQKGDNFRVPERPKDRLRYASDYLIGTPAVRGGGKPKHNFIREAL